MSGSRPLRGVVLFLMACAAAGCAELIDAPPEFSNPETPIRVFAGNTFVIRLPANRTTGYEWAVSGSIDAAHLTLLHAGYGPGPSTQPGAGGAQTFTFQANRSGQIQVSFEYRRPWEKDSFPARLRTFRIIVSG